MIIFTREMRQDAIVEETLSHVGAPLVQAAFSTLLCFLPSSIHEDYTPQVSLIFEQIDLKFIETSKKLK